MGISLGTAQHHFGGRQVQETISAIPHQRRGRIASCEPRLASSWGRQPLRRTASLEKHVAFQKLTADLSRNLASLNTETIGRKVGHGLRALADYLGADRVAILEIPVQGSRTLTIHSYTKPWLKRRGEHLMDRPAQVIERLKQGESYVDVEPPQQPASSQQYPTDLLSYGSKSTLAVPFEVDDETKYALICESVIGRRDWSLDSAQQATLLGRILVDAVMRHRAKAALREVSRRLITAHEEERNRIARDLHDDVNQRLALLCMELAHLKEDCLEDPGACAGRVEEVLTRVRDLSSDVGRIHRQLNPLKLKSRGLAVSVRSLCGEVSRLSKVHVHFHDHSKLGRMSDEVNLCLYRIAQEALHNVVKHSKAADAHVELREGPNGVEMTISDSGIGFGEEDPKTGNGLGLTSMRDRLQMVGGRLSIESSCNRGTRIGVWAPASKAAA